MTAETIISITAITILILIFILVPKIVDANERREQYSWALLKRARQNWERTMNKALDECSKRLNEL